VDFSTNCIFQSAAACLSVPAVFVAVPVQLVRDVPACIIDHIIIHELNLDRPLSALLVVSSEDFQEVVFAHLDYNSTKSHIITGPYLVFVPFYVIMTDIMAFFKLVFL
jgi:hypothetical protein